MLSLTGKTIVVTGAGRGLGRSMVETFAKAGARVVGGARSESDLAELKAAVESAGGECHVRRCDVTKPEDLQALADTAVSVFGSLDGWVNNAGGFTSSPDGTGNWLDIEPAAIANMFQLNVQSQIVGAQIAAREMRERGRGGSIIFISSIAGLYPTPGGEALYGACKASINHITDTMATELGPYGIRVNAIAPGLVETPLTAPFFPTEQEKRKRSAFYPLGRIGQPADIANAALYFLSEEAGWVSGAKLLVAGGATYTSDPYRFLQANAAGLLPDIAPEEKTTP